MPLLDMKEFITTPGSKENAVAFTFKACNMACKRIKLRSFVHIVAVLCVKNVTVIDCTRLSFFSKGNKTIVLNFS